MEFKPNEIRAFRYWIQGYQNFYEPILQEYFRVSGYEIVRRPAQVDKTDIEHARRALFDGQRQAGTEIDKRGMIQYLATRKRLQPDLQLKKEGRQYLAEFKSWGGFNASGVFDLAMLRSNFLKDLHNSAFFFIDQVAGQTIDSKILVVSARCPEYSRIQAALNEAYRTPVELLYLDEILQTPQLKDYIRRQLRYLDAAVAELKQAFDNDRQEDCS